MKTVPQFTVGQAVEIYDDFNGHNALICKGKVEKLTKAWISVRNEHGNVSKFRTKDALCMGYAWPQVTSALRPAK